MKKFPEKLKSIRKDRSITQTELAKALGVSRSTVGMYESGEREPNFEMLEAIADFFNVNMSDLIDTGKEVPTATYDGGYLPEAMSIFSELPSNKKRQALDYLRFLSMREGKK